MDLHREDCLRHLPGRLVYDNQERSVEANLSAADGLAGESFNDASSWLNGAPPQFNQEKEARVRIYEVDPVNSLLHKVGRNLLCKEPIFIGLLADIL
jgi:hypothetical protein